MKIKTFYLATDSRLLDAVGQDGPYMYRRDHEAVGKENESLRAMLKFAWDKVEYVDPDDKDESGMADKINDYLGEQN